MNLRVQLTCFLYLLLDIPARRVKFKDNLMGYCMAWNQFVPTFRRNSLFPHSRGLSFVNVDSKVTRRRKIHQLYKTVLWTVTSKVMVGHERI